MNGTLYLGKVIQMSFVDPNAPPISSSLSGKKKKKKNRVIERDVELTNTAFVEGSEKPANEIVSDFIGAIGESENVEKDNEKEVALAGTMDSAPPIIRDASTVDVNIEIVKFDEDKTEKPLTEKQIKFEHYRSRQEETFLSISANDKVYYFLDFSSLAIPEELYFPGTDASCRNYV
jgi:hypothetical protein